MSTIMPELQVQFTSHLPSPVSMDDFEVQMDDMICTYTELKNRIGNDRTKEAKEQLIKLRKYSSAVKRCIVNLYIDSIGEGFSDPKQKRKIRAAVHKVFDEKSKDTYEHKEIGKDSCISMGWLKALYSVAALFSSMKGRIIYTGLSEAEMGMDLAVVGIQIDYLLEKCNMEKGLVEVVQRGFTEFIVNYMDAQDRGWQQAVENDKYGLIQSQSVEREEVILHYNYLTKKYIKAQDFETALKAGAKYALDNFEKKYHSDMHKRNKRYSDKNHKDLVDFFHRHIYQMQDYVEESSTYEKYIAVFRNFCASIETEDFAEVEFGFLPWGMKEANPQGTKSCLDSIA